MSGPEVPGSGHGAASGDTRRVDALLRQARERIDRGEAEILLAHVTGQGRGWLYAHGERPLPPESAARYEALVERRRQGEPVAYLVGRQGFWCFDLEVDGATLIPRADTERLVELALDRLPLDRPVAVADLGTGSGAIALAIAWERPEARVVATDASDAALAVARRNAARLGLQRVEWRRGDWFAPLAGERFDLIASNPPYIAAADPHLSEGDLRHEPTSALVAGADGLDALRRLAAGAPDHLAPGGWVLFEHGWDQGAAVRGLLEAAGLVEVETMRDLEARDRVSLGRHP